MPHPRTFTTTSVARGVGSGISRYSSTSGPPNRSNATAFTNVPGPSLVEQHGGLFVIANVARRDALREPLAQPGVLVIQRLRPVGELVDRDIDAQRPPANQVTCDAGREPRAAHCQLQDLVGLEMWEH